MYGCNLSNISYTGVVDQLRFYPTFLQIGVIKFDHYFHHYYSNFIENEKCHSFISFNMDNTISLLITLNIKFTIQGLSLFQVLHPELGSIQLLPSQRKVFTFFSVLESRLILMVSCKWPMQSFTQLF